MLVDVGAHVGQFARYAASRGRAVVAIEPHAPTFRRLGRALAPYPNAEAIHAGAWDHDGRLSWAGGEDMHASYTETTGGSVPAMPLDALKTGPVGLVKIDVEGAELRVLRGATRLLREERPDVIVETHEAVVPGVTRQTRAFLEGMGYGVRVLHESALTSHLLASTRQTLGRWVWAQVGLGRAEPAGLFWRTMKSARGAW